MKLTLMMKIFLNLSNISSSSIKEDNKDYNEAYFNIDNIGKDRGLLFLFTLNINNIFQNLNKLLLNNKTNISSHN